MYRMPSYTAKLLWGDCWPPIQGDCAQASWFKPMALPSRECDICTCELPTEDLKQRGEYWVCDECADYVGSSPDRC